jgi:pilus assembly protein Flp/PilA
MGNSPRGIQMNASIRNFLIEEDGITALEYGILACIVAAALVTAFLPSLRTLYGTIMAAITGQVTAATAAPAG